eukprot:757755-Hanusia_phi.AAC.3
MVSEGCIATIGYLTRVSRAVQVHGRKQLRRECLANVFSILLLASSTFVWQGDWVENQFHGQGKYQWATGAYYMGAWEKNRFGRGGGMRR